MGSSESTGEAGRGRGNRTHVKVELAERKSKAGKEKVQRGTTSQKTDHPSFRGGQERVN